MDDTLLREMKGQPWLTQQPSAGFTPTAPNMIHQSEAAMLHWLAANAYSGKGDIGDFGCFLGGSTQALGEGLANNPARDPKRSAIHAYDIFVCPNEPRSLQMIGPGKQPGDSVRDLYEKNIASFAPLVRTHEGDIRRQSHNGKDFELVVIDIAVTPDINDHLLKTFFPKTIGPGTVIVQRSYNHPYLPWVHWTSNLMRPYADYVADVGASRVVVLDKKLPPQVLKSALYGSTTRNEKYALLEAERDLNENTYSAAMVQMSMAWLAFMEEGAPAGLDRLNHPLLETSGVPAQVENMATGMKQFANRAGLEKYLTSLYPKRR